MILKVVCVAIALLIECAALAAEPGMEKLFKNLDLFPSSSFECASIGVY